MNLFTKVTEEALWAHLDSAKECAWSLGLADVANEISVLMAHHKIEEPQQVKEARKEAASRFKTIAQGESHAP